MHFRSQRFFLVYTAMIMIIGVLFVSFYVFIARASVYNLYASTCLGGWENTHLATGAPQALESGGAPIFTEGNSAQLNGSAHAQIYCGGFRGDILENTIPKKILVKFSWAVEYPKLNSEIISTNEELATSTDNLSEDISEKSAESGVDNEPSPSAEEPIVEPEMTQSEEPVAPEVIESVPESQEQVQTEESAPIPELTPALAPEPAPLEPTVSLLNFFATVTYAQEIQVEEQTTTSTEILLETTATTTLAAATSTEQTSYGLVEVLYTLDGVEWKSLGFVEKDEFGNKHFEIPIEEVSEWEDISKIQIGIQSVPVVDGIAPILYLDSVWIETEHEYVNQNDESQLANVTSGITDFLVQVGNELVSGEEIENSEDMLAGEEDVPSEEGLPAEEIPQEYAEPPPPRLSVRNFSKDIIIDPSATHRCQASPFSIDVSGRSTFSTKIVLEKNPEEEYEMEIGGLPNGIDVRFKNDEYLYQPDPGEDTVSLYIRNEEGSRTGNFTIPVIFTEKSKQDSSVICQINIVHL